MPWAAPLMRPRFHRVGWPAAFESACWADRPSDHHPASASRPASVIVSQITLIGCRPARCSGVASPFPPVRPGVGTDDPAPGAHHARTECWHWHVVGPAIDAQHRLMVALPTT
jgi:hypothetical protein